MKAVERWKDEMPIEQEMIPKDKYTIFDRKEKKYRKSIRSEQRTVGKGVEYMLIRLQSCRNGREFRKESIPLDTDGIWNGGRVYHILLYDADLGGVWIFCTS